MQLISWQAFVPWKIQEEQDCNTILCVFMTGTAMVADLYIRIAFSLSANSCRSLFGFIIILLGIFFFLLLCVFFNFVFARFNELTHLGK